MKETLQNWYLYIKEPMNMTEDRILGAVLNQNHSLGTRFTTQKGEVFIYGIYMGETTREIGTGANVNQDTYSVFPADEGNAVFGITTKPGTFTFVRINLPGVGGSPVPSNTDYRNLINKPIWNLEPLVIYQQAYTLTPSQEYRVGDYAYSIGESLKPPRIKTSWQFMYVKIDTYGVNPDFTMDDELEPWQKCFLIHGDSSDEGIDNPFDNEPIKTVNFLSTTDNSTHYDCRIMHPVMINTIHYGWVFIHEWEGIAPTSVTPPDNILPDLTNRRKHV
jgi:hypothetical protein